MPGQKSEGFMMHRTASITEKRQEAMSQIIGTEVQKQELT